MIAFTRDILHVLRMPCREHAALMSKQLDEPLPRGIAAGLRIHILYCQGCKRFRAQIRRLNTLVGSMGQELEAGPAMPQSARERVLRRVADEVKKK